MPLFFTKSGGNTKRLKAPGKGGFRNQRNSLPEGLLMWLFGGCSDPNFTTIAAQAL